MLKPELGGRQERPQQFLNRGRPVIRTAREIAIDIARELPHVIDSLDVGHDGV